MASRYRARSHKAELAATARLADLEGDLETVIGEFVAPLYERFDGYRLSIDFITAQLAEMRRRPGFGSRDG